MSDRPVLTWSEEVAQRAGVELAKSSESARALRAKSGDGEKWANLPQHLVDSVCVGAWLWEHWLSPHTRSWLARRLGLSEHDTGCVVSWLAGAHDLGKATTVFQRKLENRGGMEVFSDRIADAGLPLAHGTLTESLTGVPHSVLSKEIQRRWLLGHKVKRRLVNALIQVGESHHGRPSSSAMNEAAADIIDEAGEQWSDVQAELADMVAEITGILPVVTSMRRVPVASELQVLTGLVIMADWIASNADAFPLGRAADQLDRVRTAMDEIPLTGPWAPEMPQVEGGDLDRFYRDVFGWPDSYRARPIQRAVLEALADVQGPCLTIIEAPTGEGKTEAGLAAGHLLAARTGAQGLMFAAPTMSTANGLFRRVTDWARTVTPEESIASMFLAHSKAYLSKDFRALKFSQIGEPDTEAEIGRGSAPEGDRPDPSEGEVVATQWLSGPKKGLLSNFVVGTVDQVLMLALQLKHSMLRHLGLSGKVIVIDEVHSFDVYMSEYLGTALAWLARYGVSVILMSATLPQRQKNALAQAYASQLTRGEITTPSTGYPLVTTVSGNGVKEKSVELGPTQAHLDLALIDDDLHALAKKVEELLADDGGICLVICNTVKRAQQAYAQLSAAYPGSTELHHAAFIASHRADKEEQLRVSLGPAAHRGSGRPSVRVIVSTQIAEQSLDIDADVLITDIAPMDLLIQRMGRIHRHSRPESDRPAGLRTPQVFVRGVKGLDPVPEFDPGTEFIYGQKLILSTLAVLQDSYLNDGFRRPDDIAHAVHTAYSEEPPIPGDWASLWSSAVHDSEVAAQASRSRATSFRIPEPGVAAHLGGLFARYIDPADTTGAGEEKGSAQVRDSASSIEVIPIIGDEYGYECVGDPAGVRMDYDVEPDHRSAFRLASATVRLPARFSKQEWKFEKTIDQLERETPLGWRGHFLLRGQVALVLDSAGEAELAGERIRYSEELGLEQVVDQKSGA